MFNVIRLKRSKEKRAPIASPLPITGKDIIKIIEANDAD